MNSTSDEIDSFDMVIAIFTPITAVILAVLGLLTVIIVYKTRLLSSSKEGEVDTTNIKTSCNISDVQNFITFMRDNEIDAQESGEIQIKDVMTVIEMLRPMLMESDEYIKIKHDGVNINSSELQELASALIKIIINFDEV